MIMMMAAMADFINPGFGNLLAGTVCRYGNRGAHETSRLIHRHDERLAPDLTRLVMRSQRAGLLAGVSGPATLIGSRARGHPWRAVLIHL